MEKQIRHCHYSKGVLSILHAVLLGNQVIYWLAGYASQ